MAPAADPVCVSEPAPAAVPTRQAIVNLSGVAAVGNEFAPPCWSPRAGSGGAPGSRSPVPARRARADIRGLLCKELLSERTAS